MKKVLLIIVVMMLASASVLALTACSASPAGVYKLESVTVKGWNYETKYNVGEEQQHRDGALFTEDSVILTLNKDGTYVFEDNSSVLNTTSRGTWELAKNEDGTKYIKFDNENFSADYTGDGLTFRYDDLGIILYTYRLKRAQ